MTINETAIAIALLAAGCGAGSNNGIVDEGAPVSDGTMTSDAGAQDLVTAGSDLLAAQNLGPSANSVALSTLAGRSDPEGVAPTSPSISKIVWKDSRHVDRAMSLYGYLYQYDFTFIGGVASAPNQVTTRSASDDAYGHAGFGFLVSHNTATGNSPLGKANVPTLVDTTAFVGGHHAIHHIEMIYDRDKEGGGDHIKIPVVIEWMVATGRDHPTWAVTWRMGAAQNPMNIDFDTYRMDVRGPYGSLNFDGAADKNQGDAIGGVSWGDFGYLFTTTDAALSMNSPWTYNQANTINFVRAWTETTNAEMGIVQTIPGDKSMAYPDRVLGRERGTTSTASYTDKGDCSGDGDSRVYAMPCVNGWPYQMMEFDWDPSGGKPLGESTGTKLIAWGSPYGWLGASSFDLFDYSAKADGRGDRSYAMFIVLGPKCRFSGTSCTLDGDVTAARKSVAALAAATIGNVTRGTLTTQLPRGPGATDLKTLASGYNDTYAAYYLDAASSAVAFTFTPASNKPVKNPIFVLRNISAPVVPTITVGGSARTVNTGDSTSGAFVSHRTGPGELWVTLNETITTATTIAIAQ